MADEDVFETIKRDELDKSIFNCRWWCLSWSIIAVTWNAWQGFHLWNKGTDMEYKYNVIQIRGKEDTETIWIQKDPI